MQVEESFSIYSMSPASSYAKQCLCVRVRACVCARAFVRVRVYLCTFASLTASAAPVIISLINSRAGGGIDFMFGSDGAIPPCPGAVSRADQWDLAKKANPPVPDRVVSVQKTNRK